MSISMPQDEFLKKKCFSDVKYRKENLTGRKEQDRVAETRDWPILFAVAGLCVWKEGISWS